MASIQPASPEHARTGRSRSPSPESPTVEHEESQPSQVQTVLELQRRLGNRVVSEVLQTARGPRLSGAAIVARALAQVRQIQRQDDDPDAGTGDSTPGTGTATIPEVTIVGNPNDTGNDGQTPAPANQQTGGGQTPAPDGQPAGTGQVTIPEVTVVGNPSQTGDGTTGGDRGTGLAAAGVLGSVPDLPGPGGPGPLPGGPGELPSIPGETPFNPNFGTPGSFVEPGSVGAGTGGAGVGGTEATGVGVGAAETAGVGAVATAGVVAAGFTAGVVGPIAVGYAIEHSEEVAQRPDPDEISPPGGAPPQADTSPDGGAGPMQAPSGQPSTPAVDPNTGQPVTLPGGDTPAPATDPSAPGTAQLPGQPDTGPAQATAVVPGPPPPDAAAIADQIPSATPGPPVQIGKTTKQTVIIGGQTHVGGDTFRNDQNGLPTKTPDGNPITYTEYDTNPYQPGVNRGDNRVVVGSDGHMYSTPDHYTTFYAIK